MAINQSLVRNDFSYRAPYGSNRRQPSYNNPTRGAAKASAPASTGSLESRSVVRGPGIENDEMDASDDADMVTQTQTPLTANARGPRYTEGSMMDLFTGQRTGTKNADYKADQPITDTNTPYLATKGFWGGIDRVLGNKSNELNEAAQQQQGANWNTANKLKDAQNREDTITNNANTFTRERDTALEKAQEKAALARVTAEEKAAGALAGTQATAAEIAERRKTMAEDRARLEAQNNRDTDNLRTDAEKVRRRNQDLADRIYLRENTLTDQQTANQEKIAAAAAKHGYDAELQQNALGKPQVINDLTSIVDGQIYDTKTVTDENGIDKQIQVPRFPKKGPRGPSSNKGSSSAQPAATATQNAEQQAGQNAEQQAPASQAKPIAASDNAPVTRSARSLPETALEPGYSVIGRGLKALNNFLDDGRDARGRKITSEASKPAYLSSDDSFVGPSEANPNAQSSESLGRERASRRTSEQLGLDYSEANPNAQSSEGLSAESFQDQLRRSQEPLGESLEFPEGFDFNSQDTNPKTPASSQGNNSESLIKSLGPGLLRAGASVPKFLQDVNNLRIAEPHLDTMAGYSVTRDGRRIEPPEIIQDSIRLGNRRAPEIMQSPEGQYEESAMLEDQYDPRTVMPKEINGRKRTLNDEEQIRIDDEMLRRAKNSRKPSFITK